MRTIFRLVVPALTEAIMRVSVPCHFKPNCGIIEARATTSQQPYVVAKALVTVYQIPRCNQRYTFCRILNLSPKPCVIRRGAALATIGEADSVRLLPQSTISNVETPSGESPPTSMEEKIKVISDLGLQVNRENLDENTCERLCNLLFNYKDIFAVKLSDLTGSNNSMSH